MGKNQLKKRKNKNVQSTGITLIALVITIIIMLILAGVVIASVVGDNGIIAKAKQAKIDTEVAGAEESIDLMLVEWQIKKETEEITFESFLQEKKDQGDIDNYSKNKGIYEVEKDGYTVVLTEDGRKATLLSMLGENPSEHYGDTINYGIDLDTGNNDSGHIPGWKIFYANEEGTYIIAADYVRTDNPILKQALTKTNMVTHSTYSAFWRDDSNLTKKDAEGNAIIDSNASKFMYNWTYGGMKMENKIAVASLLDTSAWSGFVTDGATMTIGGPTVEMFRASWNEKTYENGRHTKLQIAPSDDEYGYYIGLSNDDNYKPTSTYVSVDLDKGWRDLLYIPHDRSFNGCYGYLLMSPSASSNNVLMGVYGTYGYVG